MNAYVDRNGVEIKEGDKLHNPMDKNPYYEVLKGSDGKFYLGDFDSPIDRYRPDLFWELIE